MIAKKNPLPDVRVGQVWEDNDARSAGRTLRIIAVDDDRVTAQVLTVARNVSAKQIGKTTTIKRSRFKPTSNGYRLVTRPEGEMP